MKLTKEYFFPTITDDGVTELYAFAESILYKTGRKIPPQQHEDVIQLMILKCLEKLPEYDPDNEKGVPLGGFLYWQCRGAISIWANKHWREIPMPNKVITLLKNRGKDYFYDDF